MTEAADNRENFDFFATPMSLCRAVVAEVIPADFTPNVVVDAAAGSGHWGIAAAERWSDAIIVGQDLRPETLYTMPRWTFNMFHVGNFLTWDGIGRPIDLLLCNPPYGKGPDGKTDRKIVNKFILRSLEMLRPGGLGVFLVRIAVLCGEERAEIIYGPTPNKYTYILPQRPSYTSDGHTEMGMGYVVLVFEKGWQGDTIERRLWWEQYPNDELVLQGEYRGRVIK